MTEALLQGDDVDAQLTAVGNEVSDLRASVGIAVRDLRVLLKGVGGFPFHDERIDALLVEIPGQGFECGHGHRLDAEVEVEAFDGKIFLGLRLRIGGGAPCDEEDQTSV